VRPQRLHSAGVETNRPLASLCLRPAQHDPAADLWSVFAYPQQTLIQVHSGPAQRNHLAAPQASEQNQTVEHREAVLDDLDVCQEGGHDVRCPHLCRIASLLFQINAEAGVIGDEPLLDRAVQRRP
jgi:hypothetical protein